MNTILSLVKVAIYLRALPAGDDEYPSPIYAIVTSYLAYESGILPHLYTIAVFLMFLWMMIAPTDLYEAHLRKHVRDMRRILILVLYMVIIHDTVNWTKICCKGMLSHIYI
jgi:hypothetical protein